MAWPTGTATLVNGSNTVTAIGLDVLQELRAGWAVLFVGDPRIYEIATLTSSGSFDLASAWLGASEDAEFRAVPIAAPVLELTRRAAALVNDFQDVKDRAGTGKFAPGSLAAPSLRGLAAEDTGVDIAPGLVSLVLDGAAALAVDAAAVSFDRPIRGTAVQATPRDATAGRLMAVGGFGLGATGNDTPVLADLDATDTPAGRYRMLAATLNNASAPAALGSGTRTGYVAVHRYQDTAITQTVWSAADSAPGTYTRSHSGGWGPWRLVYDQTSILGPVAQSTGIATGAIIEQGANAGGNYVRYADGTQICWIGTIENRNLAAGQAVNGTWTFPAAFTSNVLGWGNTRSFANNAAQAAASQLGCSLAPNGATSAVYGFANHGASQVDPARLDLMAIGRWF